MRVTGFLVCVAALALLPACATPVPATVTSGPSMILEGPRTVAVTANQQGPRVEQSLRDVGLRPAAPAEAAYWLRVDIGSSRANKECGEVANVRYTLSQRGARILVLKGRGDTGSCEPNILDEMSQLLASYFSK